MSKRDDDEATVTNETAVTFAGKVLIKQRDDDDDEKIAIATIVDVAGDEVDLDRDDARRLLPFLRAFAETGRIDGRRKAEGWLRYDVAIHEESPPSVVASSLRDAAEKAKRRGRDELAVAATTGVCVEIADAIAGMPRFGGGKTI